MDDRLSQETQQLLITEEPKRMAALVDAVKIALKGRLEEAVKNGTQHTFPPQTLGGAIYTDNLLLDTVFVKEALPHPDLAEKQYALYCERRKGNGKGISSKKQIACLHPNIQIGKDTVIAVLQEVAERLVSYNRSALQEVLTNISELGPWPKKLYHIRSKNQLPDKLLPLGHREHDRTEHMIPDPRQYREGLKTSLNGLQSLEAKIDELLGDKKFPMIGLAEREEAPRNVYVYRFRKITPKVQCYQQLYDFLDGYRHVVTIGKPEKHGNQKLIPQDSFDIDPIDDEDYSSPTYYELNQKIEELAERGEVYIDLQDQKHDARIDLYSVPIS